MLLSKPDKIILGIDPGTIVMGYGLIAVKDNKATLLELGVLKPGRIKDHYKRLQLIFNTISGIIIKYQPTDFAIEAPFFGKNVQSMLKLGRAQGVAIAAALQKDISVVEYAPKRVKQSITGTGNAAKEQVAAMLTSILRIDLLPASTDATDAIAVAVCHHFAATGKTSGARSGTGKGKGWSGFIRNNPDRIV